MSDTFGDLWIAHDHPERPLTYGAWLCDCAPCTMAAQAAASEQPGLTVVLKTAMARPVIGIAAYVDAVTSGGLDALLEDGDYVREVFVG